MKHSWQHRRKPQHYQPLNAHDAQFDIKLVILGGNQATGAKENVGLVVLKQCEQDSVDVITLSESTKELRAQMYFAQLQLPNGPKVNYLQWIDQHNLEHIGVNLSFEQDRFLQEQSLAAFIGTEQQRTDHMALKIIAQIKQLPNNKGVVLLPIGSVHADRVAKKVSDWQRAV